MSAHTDAVVLLLVDLVTCESCECCDFRLLVGWSGIVTHSLSLQVVAECRNIQHFFLEPPKMKNEALVGVS